MLPPKLHGALVCLKTLRERAGKQVGERMRRKWRRLTAAAFLAALGAFAAWLWWSSPSPAILVSETLARVLGRPVEVAEVDFTLGDTFDVQLHDLRIWDEAGEVVVFRVDRALGRQRWPGLLSGRLIPLHWTLDRPVLVVTGESGAGSGEPPRLPAHDLEIRDGTVEWRRTESESWRVNGLMLAASRTLLGNRVRGTALGQLARGDDRFASFSAQFDGWLGDLDLQFTFEGIDLARIGAGAGATPGGLGRGLAQVLVRKDRINASVEFESVDFRLELPRFRGPIAPRRLHVLADAAWSDGVLRLHPRPFEMDDLVVRGDVEIRLDGAREPGRLIADLRVDDFRPGKPDGRLQLFRLIGLRHKSWRDADARTRAGIVRGVRFEVDAALDELGEVFSFSRKLRPEELTISANIQGGVYQPKPGVAPLEDLSVDVRIEGNRLLLADLRMKREGKPLPTMQITVDGMHRLVRLPPDERRTPEGPGGPIPGLGALFASIRSEEERDPEPVLELQDLRVAYPGFVLPFRDADATLRFPDGNLLVERARGVLGGAPAVVRAFWDRSAGGLTVDISYEDGDAPPLVETTLPPSNAWFDCRFSMDTIFLGRWRLDGVNGRFHGAGPTVELQDVTARLANGDLVAQGYVDLREESAAPFGFVLDLEKAEAAGVATEIGMQAGTLDGSLAAEGSFVGRLVPARSVFEDADVRLRTTIRDGTLGNTPRTVALARLASPLGWTGLFGRRLPYDEIQASFSIRNGLLRTPDFALTGPELRALAAGEIDLLDDDLQTDMVIALLFLQTIDSVLERVPFVGSWVLGQDRNLVALYFQLDGPWEAPRGRPLPPSAIQSATGWAGRLLGGGVKRIRSLLTSGSRPEAHVDPDGDKRVDGSATQNGVGRSEDGAEQGR